MKTKEELKNEFDNFIKQFDFNEYKIKSKYYHSYRVAEICEYLADQMKEEYNLNNDDIKLAYLIGLLHDIARFEQFTTYHTFSDLKSIDHGNLGEKILSSGIIRRYIIENDYDSIILKSVKYHNKFEIEDINKHTEKELLFMKLIRDADKLDIFNEMANNIIDLSNYYYENNFTPCIIETFNIGGVIELKNEKTTNDRFISFLCFVHDINYKNSFNYLYDKKYIDKIFDIIQVQESAKEVYVMLKNKVNKYIENKIM